MKNVLLTGCAGFIGSNLLDKLLNRGFKVIGVDNFSDYYSPCIKEKNISKNINNKNFKFYKYDIENIEQLKEIFKENSIDTVVHLAARPGVRPSIVNPIDCVKTNIIGTTNILECMKEYGTKKIVFSSSSSVYGNCEEEKFSEALQGLRPISPYAVSKLAGENMCYVYSKNYGINAICLRLFTVYGPRQRPDLAVNKFVDLMKNDKPIPMFGNGNTIRDYTYVDDITEGIFSAINYDKSGYEIINLGGGHPVTLKDMISVLETKLGAKAIIENLVPQQGDVEKTGADISKAKRLLNFEPKTKFEDGIGKYIEWLNDK